MHPHSEYNSPRCFCVQRMYIDNSITEYFIGWSISSFVTRLLGRRGHSLSQHTQFLKNNMIAENDSFYETLIQSSGPTRSLRSRALYASRSRKFSKKSVSQSTRNALKRIEMPKKFFTPLTDYALRA